jgi:hypothetical protein
VQLAKALWPALQSESTGDARLNQGGGPGRARDTQARQPAGAAANMDHARVYRFLGAFAWSVEALCCAPAMLANTQIMTV